MTAPKRKISVSLDADLVDELEAADEALSSQVNEAVRDTLVRRRRQRLLMELADDLTTRHGKVPEQVVERYMDLLG
jgi:metal-responsive CopG/Arc/MetJ family transcriptional regulator